MTRRHPNPCLEPHPTSSYMGRESFYLKIYICPLCKFLKIPMVCLSPPFKDEFIIFLNFRTEGKKLILNFPPIKKESKGGSTKNPQVIKKFEWVTMY